jgi:anti-sigma regulatory factor (Ser/Thr protein kinase)
VLRFRDNSWVHNEPVTYDVELGLSTDRGSAGAARGFARQTLRAADPAWRDDVVLIVSELVTNALLHGAGPPSLRLSGTTVRVRIEVTDHSPVLPAIRKSGADGGWGLPMVEHLARKWGAYPEGDGKVVWCEMAART